MAIKYIPDSWKNDVSSQSMNYNHKINFYINPRCRVLPALTETGISYIKNDAITNMRGTYRMQCGASTNLTYLYTLPQRFIIEGWIKPEFLYTVGANQELFNSRSGTNGCLLYYNYLSDTIAFATWVGGTANSIDSTAFVSDAALQNWIYVRCFFDNIAKLKGFYCVVNNTVYANSQNIPGAGAFTPLNTISFLPTVAAESSYWIIHELDETLATGAYKTYDADRQILFPFNGITLANERIRIPTIHMAGDQRGVKSYSITKSMETDDGACPGANTASMELHNINGQFSDDQYGTFDPFNGYYNGTVGQKYLTGRVPIEIESVAPASLSANDYMGYREPLFIGRTTSGAFKRNSPNSFYGSVSIDIEDYVSELGETKLNSAHAYNSDIAGYYLSYPTNESLSLIHLLTRLVTKHEVRNYCGNSGFENATIGNSWINTGLATLERSNTYSQFGTYSMKCIADGSGDNASQYITFTGADKIDVNDPFTLSAYVYLAAAGSGQLVIMEYADTTYLGVSTSASCTGSVGYFSKSSVTHIVQSATCNRLRIVFLALEACTFYVDGCMLTRGVFPQDYYLANTVDGVSGVCNADNATTYFYDTLAIDADEVLLAHPYAVINEGENVWDHLKDISIASLGRLLGITSDGVLRYATAYNETDPTVLGTVPLVSSVATSLVENTINSIQVDGVLIDKSPNIKLLFDASNLSGITRDSAGNVWHPISNGATLTVNGATVFECPYSEDV